MCSIYIFTCIVHIHIQYIYMYSIYKYTYSIYIYIYIYTCIVAYVYMYSIYNYTYSILYMYMYNNIHIQITQVCCKLFEKFHERWKTFKRLSTSLQTSKFLKFPSTRTNKFEQQVCKRICGNFVRVDDEKVCRVAELSKKFVNSKFSFTRTNFFEQLVGKQVCQQVCRVDAASECSKINVLEL